MCRFLIIVLNTYNFVALFNSLLNNAKYISEMKNKNIRTLIADDNKTFDECLSDLEKVTLAEVPTTGKDKAGGKASDAEIAKIGFIESHIDKIKGSLPADFDRSNLPIYRNLIKEKQRQIEEFERLTKAVQGQITCLRIKIKSDIKEVYAASEQATKKDASLAYIHDSIEECYLRTPSKASDTDTKKATAAAK